MDQKRFKPHSQKQEDALFSDKKITACLTGIQWGKTWTGAMWLKQLIHKHTDPTDSFIVVAPDYKIMKQSSLPAFLSVMDGWGQYRIVDAEFDVFNGGKVYFRTNTLPDSIVGITNVRAIWGDEAGKFTKYFWENIQARASFKMAPIMLTSSPYALNWVYSEIVRPHQRGEDRDIKLIQAASKENPYFPDEEYERVKRSMDPRRFNMMYGGKWDRMEGLVYDCWDDTENVVDSVNLPPGTRYFAGVDWGYRDPFVLKVRAITPDGTHYGISEFYKAGLTHSDQIQVAKQKKEVFGIEMFYCDPSQPGLIEEFNRGGLPAVGADNDIRRGIDIHYEMIKTRRYKELRGKNRLTSDEREMYHYPEDQDLKPDQNAKEAMPVDQHNHAMDADRYCSIMTHRIGQKLRAHQPRSTDKPLHQMTTQERLKRLKKGGRERHNPKAERMS